MPAMASTFATMTAWTELTPTLTARCRWTRRRSSRVSAARQQIFDFAIFCSSIPSSCDRNPAPNDHMELGQQAAFLGIMPANEMLARWFINDTKEASQQWRLKGHAAEDFWNWMASWSRMAQSPEDMGFDGSRYALPPLNIVRHKTTADVKARKASCSAAT